jgi:hypothetical protein
MGATTRGAIGAELAVGPAETDAEFHDLQTAVVAGGHGGAVAMERIIRTMEMQPGIINRAHEAQLKRNRNWSEGESFSYLNVCQTDLLPRAGNYTTLKHVAMMIARALDVCRTTKSAEHTEAFLHQCYKVTENTINSPGHQWDWSWPLLNLPSPTNPSETTMAMAEQQALASLHRDRFTMMQASAKYMPTGASSSSQAPNAAAPKWTKKEKEDFARKRKEGDAAKKKKDGDA